jgi:hypothetical protein
MLDFLRRVARIRRHEPPRIMTDSEGFVVNVSDGSAFSVRWSDVVAVLAYKRDLLTSGEVILAFRQQPVQSSGDSDRASRLRHPGSDGGSSPCGTAPTRVAWRAGLTSPGTCISGRRCGVVPLARTCKVLRNTRSLHATGGRAV